MKAAFFQDSSLTRPPRRASTTGGGTHRHRVDTPAQGQGTRGLGLYRARGLGFLHSRIIGFQKSMIIEFQDSRNLEFKDYLDQILASTNITTIGKPLIPSKHQKYQKLEATYLNIRTENNIINMNLHQNLRLYQKLQLTKTYIRIKNEQIF